jgi:hypothetical protein
MQLEKLLTESQHSSDAKKTQISFTEDSRDKSKQITDRSVGEKKISRKHHRRPTRHHDTPPSFRRRRALCCVLIGGLPVAANERLLLARMSATRRLLVALPCCGVLARQSLYARAAAASRWVLGRGWCSLLRTQRGQRQRLMCARRQKLRPLVHLRHDARRTRCAALLKPPGGALVKPSRGSFQRERDFCG